MRILEERLRQMEAALQGQGSGISTAPEAGTQIFHRSTSPDSTRTQSSGRPLTRQGAMMDLQLLGETPTQQTRANRGPIDPIDARALAPVSARYEPASLSQARAYSQPNPPPQSYQPFLGLQSLSSNLLPTSLANQARRASAATMLQRRQNRPANGSRGAAPSRAPRGPPRAADPAQSCYTEDSKIRIQVRVYPPDVRMNLSYHQISTQLLTSFQS